MNALALSILLVVLPAVTPTPNEHMDYWVKALRVSPLKMVRKNAARNLGKLGNPDVIPSLTEALGDPDPQVRLEAIKALGNLGNEKALPILAGAQDDRDKEIRRAATDAIEKIKVVTDRLKKNELKENSSSGY